MNDLQISQGVAKKDPEAIKTLVECYRSYIYTIAYKILLSEEDALDATQNVLLRILETIQKFEGRGSLKSWIGVLTARISIDFSRHKSKRETGFPIEEIEQISYSRDETSQNNNPREILIRKQENQIIEDNMALLSHQQRSIFILKFKENMKSGEIAEALGLTANQVRVQMCRAVAALQKSLTEKGYIK